MSWQGFYITYRDGLGQTLARGLPELSPLTGELEGYASGLDATGRYAAGGPLVLRLETGRRVVSWLRALPAQTVGRPGAWEAWGVAGNVEDDPLYWPWYWTELWDGPPSVTRLAERLNEGGRSTGLPEPPLALPAVLLAFQQQKEPPFVVMMREPTDLDLLPWVWLLGPLDPRAATLGPPRSRPHASRPFSYEAVWEPEVEAYSSSLSAATRTAAFSVQRIRSLQTSPAALDEILAQRAGQDVMTAAAPSAASGVSWAPKAPLQEARQQEGSMHPLGLGESLAQSAGHGAEAPPPYPKRGLQPFYYSSEKHEGKPGRLRRFFSREAPAGAFLPVKRPVVHAAPPVGRRWLIALAALLGTLVLLDAATLIGILRWQRPTPQTSRGGAANVPLSPSIRTIPPATTTAPEDRFGAVCSSEFTASTEQRQLAAALVAAAKSGKLRIGRQLEEIAVVAAGPEAPLWQQSTRDRLLYAAMQIQLRDRRCLAVQQITGVLGNQTRAALATCPAVSGLTDIDHLRWLCKWLDANIGGQMGSPPDRKEGDAD